LFGRRRLGTHRLSAGRLGPGIWTSGEPWRRAAFSPASISSKPYFLPFKCRRPNVFALKRPRPLRDVRTAANKRWDKYNVSQKGCN